MVTKNYFVHLANISHGNPWAREMEVMLYGEISIENSNNVSSNARKVVRTQWRWNSHNAQ